MQHAFTFRTATLAGWLIAATIGASMAQEPPPAPAAIDLTAPQPFPKQLIGAEVPLPIRISGQLSSLGRVAMDDREEYRVRAEWRTSNAGLDPASAAAVELVALAKDLETRHPPISRELIRRGQAEGSLDLTTVGGWLDQRYAKVGTAVGIWLKARKQEGWPIEPLIDRVFKGVNSGPNLFSDNEDFEDDVLRYCHEFNSALEAELGYLPQQFAVPSREELAAMAAGADP